MEPRCSPCNSDMATELRCSQCDREQTRSNFSKVQLRKHPTSPRCRECAAPRAPPIHQLNFPAEARAEVDRLKSAGLTRATVPTSGCQPNNFGFSVYLDKIFSMNCFPELIQRRVFPSAKDVTEAYAAINAANRHSELGELLKGVDVLCVCVGDGCSPRTATLAAYLTRWHCLSVDPNLHDEWTGAEHGIQRLGCFAQTWEEYARRLVASEGAVVPINSPRALVLLCVHSHHRFGTGEASIEAVRTALGSPPTCLVSIPCCHKWSHVHDVGQPHATYEDWGIFSACRLVNVWTWGVSQVSQRPPV